jgi:hypothetical protein
MNEQLRRGRPLAAARVLKGLTQQDLYDRAGVAKWRGVQAELDRLSLRDVEVSRIEKILNGDDVLKMAPTAIEDAVQKAFDLVEIAAKQPLSDAERSWLAEQLISLRHAAGLDAIKFVGGDDDVTKSLVGGDVDLDVAALERELNDLLKAASHRAPLGGPSVGEVERLRQKIADAKLRAALSVRSGLPTLG